MSCGVVSTCPPCPHPTQLSASRRDRVHGGLPTPSCLAFVDKQIKVYDPATRSIRDSNGHKESDYLIRVVSDNGAVAFSSGMPARSRIRSSRTENYRTRDFTGSR